MTQGYSQTTNRRGLRQDIVVQALKLMQGNEASFALEAGLSDTEFSTLARDLLIQAETEVLGYSPPPRTDGEPPDLPRYVNATVFKELMGVGRLSRSLLEDLVKARLELSSGATDGK
jgi:hypothetical protein